MVALTNNGATFDTAASLSALEQKLVAAGKLSAAEVRRAAKALNKAGYSPSIPGNSAAGKDFKANKKRQNQLKALKDRLDELNSAANMEDLDHLENIDIQEETEKIERVLSSLLGPNWKQVRQSSITSAVKTSRVPAPPPRRRTPPNTWQSLVRNKKGRFTKKRLPGYIPPQPKGAAFVAAPGQQQNQIFARILGRLAKLSKDLNTYSRKAPNQLATILNRLWNGDPNKKPKKKGRSKPNIFQRTSRAIARGFRATKNFIDESADRALIGGLIAQALGLDPLTGMLIGGVGVGGAKLAWKGAKAGGRLAWGTTKLAGRGLRGLYRGGRAAMNFGSRGMEAGLKMAGRGIYKGAKVAAPYIGRGASAAVKYGGKGLMAAGSMAGKGAMGLGRMMGRGGVKGMAIGGAAALGTLIAPTVAQSMDTDSIKEELSSLWDTTVEKMRSGWTSLSSMATGWIDSALTGTQDWVSEKASSISNTISSSFTGLIETSTALYRKVTGFFDDFSEWLEPFKKILDRLGLTSSDEPLDPTNPGAGPSHAGGGAGGGGTNFAGGTSKATSPNGLPTNDPLASSVNRATTEGTTYTAPVTANAEQTRREQWVASIRPAAEAEAARRGITPEEIIAQAAHETGWGKATIGNNIFGIKADPSWQGKTQTVATQENYGGGNVNITDKFRDYDSIEDSIRDHGSFLEKNSRYRDHGYFNATTPEGRFAAMKRAGYATDPDYVAKLSNINKMVKDITAKQTVVENKDTVKPPEAVTADEFKRTPPPQAVAIDSTAPMPSSASAATPVSSPTPNPPLSMRMGPTQIPESSNEIPGPVNSSAATPIIVTQPVTPSTSVNPPLGSVSPASPVPPSTTIVESPAARSNAPPIGRPVSSASAAIPPESPPSVTAPVSMRTATPSMSVTNSATTNIFAPPGTDPAMSLPSFQYPGAPTSFVAPTATASTPEVTTPAAQVAETSTPPPVAAESVPDVAAESPPAESPAPESGPSAPPGGKQWTGTPPTLKTIPILTANKELLNNNLSVGVR